MREIARQENITPDPEAVQERADALMARQRSMNMGPGQLDPDEVRSYTENIVANEMTLDLIERVARGNEEA